MTTFQDIIIENTLDAYLAGRATADATYRQVIAHYDNNTGMACHRMQQPHADICRQYSEGRYNLNEAILRITISSNWTVGTEQAISIILKHI